MLTNNKVLNIQQTDYNSSIVAGGSICQASKNLRTEDAQLLHSVLYSIRHADTKSFVWVDYLRTELQTHSLSSSRTYSFTKLRELLATSAPLSLTKRILVYLYNNFRTGDYIIARCSGRNLCSS